MNEEVITFGVGGLSETEKKIASEARLIGLPMPSRKHTQFANSYEQDLADAKERADKYNQDNYVYGKLLMEDEEVLFSDDPKEEEFFVLLDVFLQTNSGREQVMRFLLDEMKEFAGFRARFLKLLEK